MVKITIELIRKKTEHHDGLLEDLEEITLHQLNIEKLELIGRICPRLKILYLQNNLIGKIENIKRLKSLVYLNLALNNITSIPREIAQCEKLRKLDLTINFIDVDEMESSVTALAELIFLDELYMTGNPCASFPGYRLYMIHRLTKLAKLDGTEVTRGERIQAKAAFDKIAAELAIAAKAKRKEKGIVEAAASVSSSSSASTVFTSPSGGATIEEIKDDDDRAEEAEKAEAKAEETYAQKSQKVTAYTPESRLEMHREQEAFEKKKEEDKKKSQKGDQPEDLWKEAQNKMNQKVTGAEAEGDAPKQRNLGKWDFTVEEKGSNIVIDIAVQRFLDTSLIDIDVHPTWFQVLIKGKLLLLHFPEEIQATQCKIQRLQVNGHLVLTAPKVKKIAENATQFSTSSSTKSTAVEPADGEEKEDDDESDGPRSSKTTHHSSVLDLSSKAVPGRTNAFQSHMGASLNQVTSDYRHIARKRDGPASGAQMREVTSTRSATLEQARLAEQDALAEKRRSERNTEEERAELERLGLDDTGVPDLE